MKCRELSLIAKITRFLLLILLLGRSALSSDTGEQRINLLDAALKRSQRSPGSFNYARSSEAFFLGIARSFTIEDVLTNPFYAPSLTQVYANRMNGMAGLITPGSLFETAYQMTGSELTTVEPPVYPPRSLMDVLEAIQFEFGKSSIQPGTRKHLDEQIRAFPSGLEEPVILICEALMSAVTFRQSAISAINPKDRLEFLSQPLRFCVSSSPLTQIRLLSTPKSDQLDLLKQMQRIDMHLMAKSMKLMTDAIEMSRQKLDFAIKQTNTAQHDGLLLDFHSPVGPILIGGPGINRYNMDAALIVDLGGSDFYSNNAGGSLGVKGGVACVIDMGGNDVYYNPQAGVQGSGTLGIGILIDYRGSDSYLGGDLSQGSAVGGIGLLYDEKDSDTYTAGVFTQGAGMFGIGINADIDGDDFYACDSLGQGFGSTMGIGVLTNLKGNDNYVAGVDTPLIQSRFSGVGQGSAMGIQSLDFSRMPNFWGGIGFLVEGQGNDRYQGGHFSQGASRCLSLGALIDSQGDDIFTAISHSQGSASYLSLGILVDQSGVDRYQATVDSQGVGENRAAGLLLDYKGDDRYKLTDGGGQGFGRGPIALGIQIDYSGDDKYESTDFSQGDVFPAADPFSWPTGILIDHYGQETYLFHQQNGAARGNDITWVSRQGGVGVDTSLPPVMYFANQTGKGRYQLYDMPPIPEIEDTSSQSSALGSDDYYQRFHALSQILSSKKRNISALVKAIDLGHSEYRRLLMEGILITLYSNPITTADVTDLSLLCEIDDSDLKRFFIEIAEFRRAKSGSSVILSLLNDSDSDVRRAAIWTIGELHDTAAIDRLVEISHNDIDSRCRQEAIHSLSVLAPKEYTRLFIEKLEDPNDGVQYACLNALGKTGAREAVATLQLWASSEDLHFRRSAAKSLVQLGEKTGLPVLIDSLRSISLDNSTYQTDNLPVFLMQHTNVDYGFDLPSWEKWWQESERTINLPSLLQSRSAYLQLIANLDEMSSESIDNQITELHAQFPGYHGCDTTLAEALNYIASDREFDSNYGSIDAIRCVRLAIRLDDIPQYHVKLIEMIAGTGNLPQALIEINSSLKIHPRNEDLFKLRLQIQSLQN